MDFVIDPLLWLWPRPWFSWVHLDTLGYTGRHCCLSTATASASSQVSPSLGRCFLTVPLQVVLGLSLCSWIPGLHSTVLTVVCLSNGVGCGDDCGAGGECSRCSWYLSHAIQARQSLPDMLCQFLQPTSRRWFVSISTVQLPRLLTTIAVSAWL